MLHGIECLRRAVYSAGYRPLKETLHHTGGNVLSLKPSPVTRIRGIRRAPECLEHQERRFVWLFMVNKLVREAVGNSTPAVFLLPVSNG